jgi:AhpD family alkylhydroperoxidase
MPRVAVPGKQGSIVDRVWDLRPALKPAWFAMKDAVKERTGLPIDVREVVRYRLAGLNGCQLCLAGRDPEALAAGFDEETYRQIPSWRESTLFSSSQRAALDFADLFAQDHLRVDDALFERLSCHFDDGEIAALAFFVARYLGFGRLAHVLGLDDACDISGTTNALDFHVAPSGQPRREVTAASGTGPV